MTEFAVLDANYAKFYRPVNDTDRFIAVRKTDWAIIETKGPFSVTELIEALKHVERDRIIAEQGMIL